jgi:hypothetical protein
LSKKERSFSFSCRIQKETQDVNYIYLHLFDHGNRFGTKDHRGFTKFKDSLDNLREFDLILISEQPIPGRFVWDSEFLFKMRDEPGKFLATVRQPRKQDSNYVKIKVDNMLEEYFSINQFKLFDTELHCYYLGSLMTTVREFRTIKNCEFFHTGPIIFNPNSMHQQEAICNEQDSNQMKKFIERNVMKFNKS